MRGTWPHSSLLGLLAVGLPATPPTACCAPNSRAQVSLDPRAAAVAFASLLEPLHPPQDPAQLPTTAQQTSPPGSSAAPSPPPAPSSLTTMAGKGKSPAKKARAPKGVKAPAKAPAKTSSKKIAKASKAATKKAAKVVAAPVVAEVRQLGWAGLSTAAAPPQQLPVDSPPRARGSQPNRRGLEPPPACCSQGAQAQQPEMSPSRPANAAASSTLAPPPSLQPVAPAAKTPGSAKAKTPASGKKASAAKKPASTKKPASATKKPASAAKKPASATKAKASGAAFHRACRKHCRGRAAMHVPAPIPPRLASPQQACAPFSALQAAPAVQKTTATKAGGKKAAKKAAKKGGKVG